MKACSRLLQIIGTFGCLYIISETLLTKASLAQINPDNTLNTQVDSKDDVSEITGGQTRGSNLFHSFQDFSVNTGNEAFFNHADNIENIFSRVTGGSVSNIDGMIRNRGDANLFFINPAGIIFGENASLNIGGSFFASTADRIIFPDREFSAIATKEEPILTVDVPIGLGFGDNLARIVNRSTVEDGIGLEVAREKRIALVGGEIHLDGGMITASEGKIELASVGENSVVNLEENSSRFDFQYDNVSNFNNVRLTKGAAVDSSGVASGEINIRGNQISLEGSSQISGATFGSIAGKDISVNAEVLSIKDGARIFTSTVSEGNAGNINVAASSLEIEGRGFEEFEQTFVGNFPQGSLNLEALAKANPTGIYSGTTGTGTAGNIDLDTINISLFSGAFIGNFTFGTGAVGALTINAAESVEIVSSGVFNVPNSASSGNGNIIDIQTSNLSILDSGLISSATFGTGSGGDIAIDVSENIEVLEALPNSSIQPGIFSNSIGGQGKAGNIEISTQNLNLQGGGQITSVSGALFRTETIFQGGTGGDINIEAVESIEVSGISSDNAFTSTINSSTFSQKNAGNLTIEAENLIVSGGATINASTFGDGQGGDLNIDVDESLAVDGASTTINGFFPSSISSASLSIRSNSNLVRGNAGNVNISTNNLFLTNGGIISASTDGLGEAGAVNITAEDTIVIDGEGAKDFNSAILNRVFPGASGDAGNIAISAKNLSLTNGGAVSASTLGEGNAGSVAAIVEDSISLDGEQTNKLPSAIASQVFSGASGNAGNVNLTTKNLSLTDGGAISVSTFDLGNADDATINATESIVISGTGNNNRSGIFAVTVTDSDSNSDFSGNGGNINVFTNQLNISDGGTIEAGNLDRFGVFAPGTGSPGNINIEAGEINLSNQGRIEAATLSETGSNANINLRTDNNITLQNNSFISAQAFGEANGGNLSINSQFILATPNQNNDLVASAEQGTGGNINIFSAGVFGLNVRSSNPPNNTNDIDASSELGINGTVDINTTNDFQNSFELVNPEFAVAQKALQGSCFVRSSDKKGSFIYGGTGGLPVSPASAIDEEASLSSQLPEISSTNTPDTSSTEAISHPQSTSEQWQIGDPIVEPTNLITTADGRMLWVNNKVADASSLTCR